MDRPLRSFWANLCGRFSAAPPVPAVAGPSWVDRTAGSASCWPGIATAPVFRILGRGPAGQSLRSLHLFFRARDRAAGSPAARPCGPSSGKPGRASPPTGASIAADRRGPRCGFLAGPGRSLVRPCSQFPPIVIGLRFEGVYTVYIYETL